jgi:ABC-type bacteriocin/lantibiotic exporter with double-glycine peptidase domain
MALAQFYGVSTTISDLRKRLVTDPTQGTAIKQFQAGLSDLFFVQIGRQPLDHLDEALYPFIAFWPQQAHFVVVWSIDEHHVIFGDPGSGLQTMPIGAFFQYWDGITIVLRPREPSQQRTGPGAAASSWAITRSFFGAAKLELFILLIPATILGLSNTAFSVFFPYYLAHLHRLFLLTAAFLLVSVMLSAITAVYVAYLRRRLNQHLGRILEPAIEHIDTSFYTMGDAYTRFHDVQHVVDVVLGLVRDIPYTVSLGIGTFGYLLYRNASMTLVLSGLVVVLLTGLTPFMFQVRDYLYQIRLRSTHLNNALRQQWGQSSQQILESFYRLIETTFRQTLWSIPINIVTVQTPVLGILVVALLIGFGHSASPPVATLLSTLFLVNYFTSASHALYQKYVAWQVAQPSLRRLYDFVEAAELR